MRTRKGKLTAAAVVAAAALAPAGSAAAATAPQQPVRAEAAMPTIGEPPPCGYSEGTFPWSDAIWNNCSPEGDLVHVDVEEGGDYNRCLPPGIHDLATAHGIRNASLVGQC